MIDWLEVKGLHEDAHPLLLRTEDQWCGLVASWEGGLGRYIKEENW
jgi:hypothetical protein